jgi:hypothetical protein
MKRFRLSASGRRKIESAIARGWHPGGGHVRDFIRRQPKPASHANTGQTPEMRGAA